ncbi:DUF6588 family protein [Gillisia limnaea]|uniref:Secreted protein n=1 Tax=Gillisia limnaea (strain DSM 15749 / LMG 21470 / R-8282) TaxID=865937 RepID=H2BY91_GILLR|nr:DUF6588 family protein [Gillisia limnaea]EHQ02183.1 hypothetical protein Gilli_1536 [Gillisia limnaea DSM 15749]
MRNYVKLFPVVCFLLIYNGTTAQSTPSDQQLLINDMLLVADNFAAPGAEGAAIQSSAGWFSSASAMDEWTIEFSVHGNALFIPKSKQNKVSSNSDFSILTLQGGSNALLPTVFGGDSDAVFEGSIFGQNFSFDAIEGLDKKVLIHPFPQVTVGLPYGTEIAARYLPSIIINDVGFSTYGIGLKHNFTQYYERRFNPEDFQFAAVVTYSNFKVDYAFIPVDIQIAELNRIDVNANLWLAQLMGSKLYDTFEVFGAVGVTNSNFDYEMGGSGPGLGLLNESLTAIGGNEAKFKGDIGFNYYFDNFKVSTMFTAGSLFNANIGLHYRIK